MSQMTDPTFYGQAWLATVRAKLTRPGKRP
jgi:hypothetical protein